MRMIRLVLVIVSVCLLYSCGAQEREANRDNSEIRLLGDSIVEIKSFYKDGIVSEIMHYNNDKQLHGEYLEWYGNGTKKRKWNYNHDELNGKQLSWDEKGNVTIEENYLNGIKEGFQINFENKDTLRVEYYKVGKLIFSRIPENDYKPSSILLANLMSQGLDSSVSVQILKNDLSGYIVKDKGRAVFIEDSAVAGIIGDVYAKAAVINRTKYDAPLTFDYLYKKGLTKKQIEYLIKNKFIDIEDKKKIVN
jgi:hypothetical protein